MKKIFFSLTLLLGLVASCDDPNEGEMFVTPTNIQSEMSMIDILENDPNESMWIDFLKYADYYNALKDASSTATVFCPTNEAMRKFLDERGVENITDLDQKYAREVAQAHIIPNVEISDSTLNDYAESNSYIPTQCLFNTYLSLRYGYTKTDVDDAERTDELFNTDSVYINNQAKMDKFTGISCANGHIFTMADVIRPLSETILQKLQLDDDYSIFAQAITDCGYDSVANKVRDTTNVIGGGQVVNNYFYTCFAVPNEYYHQAGINDVEGLKAWLVNNSNGEETDGNTALSNYMRYHFMAREYPTSELFDFQIPGQTLIFETNYSGQALITDSIEGHRVINKSIPVLRSDVEARNGLINKVGGIMPVYHPAPVTVRWDFLNSADIIAIANAFGAAKGYGQLFTAPLASSERRVDLSDDHYDGNYGNITSFTYKANSSAARVSNYRRVGFYKEKYANATHRDQGQYGAYMNNYLCLNLGYAGWIQMTSPTIIAGKYKVVLHYLKDITQNKLFAGGSLTRFDLDDNTTSQYVFKGLKTMPLYGTAELTLWNQLEFEGSGNHTFKVTMMDINAKESNTYHQMLDYLEFIPIE